MKQEAKGLTRRSFLTGAGVALAGTAGIGVLASCSSQDAQSSNTSDSSTITIDFVNTVTWDAEYDLVVVGFGGAGGCAAIAGADEGASVLLVEKGAYGGGNTALSEQVIMHYETKEAGQEFLHAMFAGFETATDEIIDYIVDSSIASSDWAVKTLGAEKGITKPPRQIDEYVGEMPCLAEGTAFVGCLDERWGNDKYYWNLVKDNVEKRKDNITVLFNSPVTKLIQDPFSKTVLGAVVDTENGKKNVRAKKGVILACGSYEANLEMYENFRQFPDVYPTGTLNNTGDGIMLGISAGAQLWHMAAISGPWLQPKKPDADQCFFFNVGDDAFVKSGNSLLVGKDGTRFVDETAKSRHGHIPYGGSFIPQVVPDVIYAVFDQTGYDSGGSYGMAPADLPQEIFVKADTIEGLIDQIDVDKDGFMDQFNRYNQYAADGYDPQYGRNPAKMGPVETPPFYAVRLYGSCVNAQGGPKRNTKCQVLDTENNPIPHLYSAGELGSFWAGLYIAGGNLAETLYTGRDAAKNALQESEEVAPTELTIVASSPEAFANALDAPSAKDTVTLGENEYVGVGQGMHGEITVKVKIENGTITAVDVIEQNETPDISKDVWATMPQAIVDANSTDIDTVAGATLASKGLLEAVDDAVSQAK